MIDQAIPLQQLPAGHAARICRIFGLPDDVHRLEEFGLRCGTCIEMFRCGDPCIIRMGGQKVCLRGDQVLRILVAPLERAGGRRNGLRRGRAHGGDPGYGPVR